MESKDSKKQQQHEQLDEAAVNMASAQIVATESQEGCSSSGLPVVQAKLASEPAENSEQEVKKLVKKSDSTQDQ